MLFDSGNSNISDLFIVQTDERKIYRKNISYYKNVSVGTFLAVNNCILNIKVLWCQIKETVDSGSSTCSCKNSKNQEIRITELMIFVFQKRVYDEGDPEKSRVRKNHHEIYLQLTDRTLKLPPIIISQRVVRHHLYAHELIRDSRSSMTQLIY